MALLTYRLAIALVLLCSACTTTRPGPDALPTADALLLGEQHDAPQHQLRHRDAVQTLAAQSRLAAVALEMAEQGTSTTGLSTSADEASVRAALNWNDEAWPWSAYGPAVMAAVRAGVPVLGANLPRARMREAMADAALDTALDAAAMQAQREAIHQGHCGLLPQAQLGPMTRIQIARDQAMAATVAQAVVPGKTVLLLAGAGHVDEALGVPRHLPRNVQVRSIRWPAPDATPKDYCAELQKRFSSGR